MTFVAVLCLNDYPHSVSISVSTRELAEREGEKMRDKANQEHEARSLLVERCSFGRDRLIHPLYFHYHVLEQPCDRRKGERRLDHRSAGYIAGQGSGRRTYNRRKS